MSAKYTARVSVYRCEGLRLIAAALWWIYGLITWMHMCVQAESLWLHLGIIKELAAMCHSVFQGGDVRYGYTTVPTYPR